MGLHSYFIGKQLKASTDVFEQATLKLMLNFNVFLVLLTGPFILQIASTGHKIHLYLNTFQLFGIIALFYMFRKGYGIRPIGITYLWVDCIMSLGSLIAQNGTFDLQAELWLIVLILYSFLVLDIKWGLISTLFSALLYAGCIKGQDGKAFLDLNIPGNKMLDAEEGFIVVPFIIILYIVIVFVNVNVKARKQLNEQNKLLTYQKSEIISSIVYAQKIQQAKLPEREHIEHALPEVFILYKPKDIVSGDFYFFYPKEDYIYLAAADCTGHGVPGAILSMIASEKLEDAVQQESDPGKILQYVNRTIKTALRQNEKEGATRDGMDIALCRIDKKNRLIAFSGANRPLWIYRKEKNEIEVTPGTKRAIGGLSFNEITFSDMELFVNNGDTVYLFTDGYADQFGGIAGKKMMNKNLNKLLVSIQTMSLKDQEAAISEFFQSWKGLHEQVDDVLIIGFRL